MNHTIHTHIKMRIENWILKGAGKLEGLVLPEEYDKSNVLIVGKVYGREDFPDGTLISTSPVVKISESHATTHSGTVYELGEKHPDYVKFINAAKNSIPILKEWKITSGCRPNKFFGKQMGYEKIYGKGIIHGEITSHDNNTNLYVLDNKTTVFIDWLSVDFGQYTEMSFFWNNDLRQGLLEFANTIMKLNLNGIHKELF